MTVAVREYPTDRRPMDYRLLVEGKPVGVVEAKREEEGHRLTAVDEQSAKYAGAQEVPKTLIFAKTDSHADDIIQIVREARSWRYRTNVHHTLKRKPMRFDDLREFIECINPRTVMAASRPGARTIPRGVGAASASKRS